MCPSHPLPLCAFLYLFVSSSALFYRVDSVRQPRSVLEKGYTVEPHRGRRQSPPLSRHTDKHVDRPPAPQPPYRIEAPTWEPPDPKEEVKRLLREKKAYMKAPVEAPRRVLIAAPHRDVCEAPQGPSYNKGHPQGPPYNDVGPWGPAHKETRRQEAPYWQQPPQQKRIGRRSLSTSFVCRAHRGRHLHLLDLSTPVEMRPYGGPAVSIGEEYKDRGTHRPDCSSAYLRFRRCGCNEAELPVPVELGAQPQQTRQPHYEGPRQGPPVSEEEVMTWSFAQEERDQAEEQTPQKKAQSLGLDLKYYLRNYSDPELLFG